MTNAEFIDRDLATRKSGVYGLFRLDGAPIESRQAEALGLPTREGASRLVEAVDRRAPHALHRLEDDDGLTVVAGELEDTDDLADRLALSRSAPQALLARAALQRFAGDTPAEMIGEWSLLHCDRAGSVILMCSAARRDPILYALSGPRLAVSPDLFRLARLDWVGRDLDDVAVFARLGRKNSRRGLRDRTMLANVRQLEPAESVIINRQGAPRRQIARVLSPQPRRSGSFADLMAEAEQLMLHVMRSRLARAGKSAPLLSGGLDSSLLAWLAAQVRPHDSLVFVTSVAPPGSGLPDEAAFADAVAGRLGVRPLHIWPAADLDTYRPSDAILAGANGPPLPNRHCQTETMQQAAESEGASLLVNGTYGEMTLSAPLGGDPPTHPLRAFAARIKRAVVGSASPGDRPNSFQVRLAPHRRAAVPKEIQAAQRAPETRQAAADDLFGYQPGVEAALAHPNEFYAGAIRMDFPYRDLRLLRLLAGFPVSVLLEGGADRGPARHLLEGRLPDSVRLRRSGLPASPDHLARIKRQAPAARARIAAFRAAGVDDWLDLDWLDQNLARVGGRGPVDHLDANNVQLTAIAAEFFTWWREHA